MGEILGVSIGNVRAMFSNTAVLVVAAILALMVGHQILVKTTEAIFTHRRRVSPHQR